MFKTNLAMKNWAAKYQYNNETPIETQKRIAKAVASVEKNPEEWEEKFLNVLVKFDSDGKPTALKNTFGGRITANIGTKYNGTTLLNCFSGEEEILTDKGVGSFKELEGQKVNVLADGAYVEAKIDKFGKQQLQRVTFRPCYKQDPIFDNQTSPIYVCKHGRYALSYKVTPNHTWILSDGEETDNIKVGDVVQSSVATFNEGSYDYQSGFRHGFVCGDGSDQYIYKNGDHRYVLRLFGEKDMKYAHMFDEVKEDGHMKGLGGETAIRSDANLKKAPIFGLSADYYSGFIYGLLAADGCILDENRVELSSTNTEIINWVRKYAPYAGMLAIGYRVDYHSLETNFGKRKELLKRLTLTKRDDIYFKVTSIEYLIEEEEVYCAVVEEKEKFTLSSGVLTHNCFVNGPVSSANISYDRHIPGTEDVVSVNIDTQSTPDNLSNIMLTLLEQAETLKSEGGYGLNFGFIRPRGTVIKSIGIRHPGVVHYMSIWDVVAGVIVMGDNDGYKDNVKNYLNDLEPSIVSGIKKQARKGAQMAVLPIWHPDVEEFIRAKQEEGKLTKFNISVLIDDAFMNAVINDDFYDLHFDGKVYKRVKAKELYEVVIKSSHTRNEPGVLFYDSMQKNNPMSYIGDLSCTNPCLAKGSLVSTDRGIIPVEEVTVKDSVQTIFGYKPITSIEISEAEIYRVSFTDGSYVDATKGHIFHTQLVSGESRKKWTDEYRLSEIEDYDFFVRKSPYMLCESSKKIEKDGIFLTRDLGLLLGLYLGDGCFSNYQCFNISCNSDQDNSFIEDLYKRFGWNCRIDKSEGKTVRYYATNVKNDISKIFSIMDLQDKGEKTFPYWWLNTCDDFRAGLIDGLICSDGNVNEASRYPQIRFKNTSMSLHNMIRHLMLTIGADYKIYMCGEKGDKGVIYSRVVERTKDIYEGVLDNESILAIHKITGGFSDKKKDNSIKNIIKNTSLIGLKWKSRVKSIDYIGEGTVYDIFEETTDTWVAGGFVHRGCGEIGGNSSTSTVCLLGSVNLTQYVNDDRSFDFDKYKEDVSIFARMLDNVNDLTEAPLPQYIWAVKNIRQYGMGINGLGSTLYMMGIPYNSDEAVEFTKQVTWLKEEITWRTSALLAEEKGACKIYNEKFLETNWFNNFTTISDETKDLIRKYGVRNGKTTSNPPLGNCQPISSEIISESGVMSFSEIFNKFNIPLDETGWHIREECDLKVKTMNGLKKILAFYVNGESKTNKIITNDGKLIEGTDEHKVLVKVNENKAEWKRLREVKEGDILISMK